MTTALGGNSAEQLKSIIERIERLEGEKKILADDIRDLFAEAKGNGLNVKALREIIRMRKQDRDEREKHEETLAIYLDALGMLAGSPLGDWAVKKDLSHRA